MASLRRFQASKRAFSSLSYSKQAHSPGETTEELLESYRSKGYLPVHIGDSFRRDKYKVVRKLGYGDYSTVWLAQDLQWLARGKPPYVALKILKAKGRGKGQEAPILHRQKDSGIPGADRIVRSLGQFWIRNKVGGKRKCFALELTGPSLSEYQRLFPDRRIPIPIAKRIARQVLQGLVHLHDTRGIVHTNIQPQNILIKTPDITKMFYHSHQRSSPFNPPENFYMKSEPVTPRDEELSQETNIFIRLAGLGAASYMNKKLYSWSDRKSFRPPEVILDAPWDHKVDIWNFGLMMWELVLGNRYFDNPAVPYHSDTVHLAHIEEKIGLFPDSLLNISNSRDKFFDSQDRLRNCNASRRISLECLCGSRSGYGWEIENFTDFILSTLALEPRRRPSASELLKAKWLQDTTDDYEALRKLLGRTSSLRRHLEGTY